MSTVIGLIGLVLLVAAAASLFGLTGGLVAAGGSCLFVAHRLERG